MQIRTIHSPIRLKTVRWKKTVTTSKQKRTKTSSGGTPAVETHQADVAADMGIGYPQHDETAEANAMSEHSNAYPVTSAGQFR